MTPDPPCIALSDCHHGRLYRINARRIGLGLFVEARRGFIGIREKWDRRYLFLEYHWDTGEPFGTVCPIALLEDTPPGGVPLVEQFAFCEECKGPLHRREDGWMVHSIAGSCAEQSPLFVLNQELFNWMEQMERKHAR